MIKSWLKILPVLVLTLAAAASAQPPHRVADLNTTQEDLSPPLFTDQNFAVLGTTVFFLEDDSVHGVELWKTDGTAAGTALVKDICPGACWAWPQSLTVWNGAVYFSADDGIHGREPWKTDGTAAGTSLVADVNPGLSGSDPQFLVAGGTLYLTVDDGTHGRELWKTDGTAAGTALVADIQPGPVGSNPRLWLDLGNGKLLINADDGVHGREPWISDGTPAGTVLLADLNPGAGDSTLTLPPFNLENDAFALGGGSFLFTADDGAHGAEPWKSDGTPGGTALFVDVNPGSAASYPHGFTRLGSTILFGATTAAADTELWSTDGTPGGTALLKDVNPGSGNGWVHGLTAAGAQAFFFATDATTGQELWRTDGTPAGTAMVADIVSGAGFPVIQGLTAIDSLVLFSADDGVHGRELWRSDGVAAGTFQVADIAPGAAPSSPLGFTLAGPNVYFAANDGVTGFEPWAVPEATVLTTFQDVPGGYWAWRYVEALFRAGVTGGCGGGGFCPDALVNRAQMSVFLLTARGTPPPPATGTLFQDVPPGYWAGAWIEELAREGVASGCSVSPPLFCPDTNLTRAQMAILLVGALHQTPPAATGTRFADVPAGYYAARWIEQLAADGITNGCGGGNFCPDLAVTRAEMAVSLTTAFHLPLP
ncbi:MAG TPA: ELWxxDGT repeat protein [Thermoanaerobaculia bacterium]|nr:ELWxxDGT repeat protein [Thermoanaerobaculia bacterium]